MRIGIRQPGQLRFAKSLPTDLTTEDTEDAEESLQDGNESQSKNWRDFPCATFAFDHFGHREHLFVLPRASGDLHPDGKALRRVAYGQNRGRISQKIKPLGVTPGVQILDRVASDLPATFAMPKCRNGRRWT